MGLTAHSVGGRLALERRAGKDYPDYVARLKIVFAGMLVLISNTPSIWAEPGKSFETEINGVRSKVLSAGDERKPVQSPLGAVKEPDKALPGVVLTGDEPSSAELAALKSAVERVGPLPPGVTVEINFHRFQRTRVGIGVQGQPCYSWINDLEDAEAVLLGYRDPNWSSFMPSKDRSKQFEAALRVAKEFAHRICGPWK